jgi:hypothetical protein
MGTGAAGDRESAAWADAGLAAFAGLTVPVFGEVALLFLVAVAVPLDCARLGAFAGSLAWATVSADKTANGVARSDCPAACT